MYEISKNTINETEVKKSRFVTLLFKVTDVYEINPILEQLRQDYKGANHYCYAYIIENNQKYSDDGEPNGTAGLPMLDILKKKNINNILAVAIRYFGGIKLGASGLIRAYREALVEAICNTPKKIFASFNEIIIETEFSNQRKLDRICKDVNIINKEYNIAIKYVILIEEKLTDDFIQKLELNNLKFIKK